MKIVLIHGWALSPPFWDKLIDEIHQEFPSATFNSVNLGFFGAASQNVGHFDLAIVHSFGLMWFLNQLEITCDQIVSISGFTRFFRSKTDRDFPGIFQNVIQRMRSRLEHEPQSLLADFYLESGIDELSGDAKLYLPDPKEEFSKERLDWGLCGLNTFDHREQWTSLNIEADRRLIIAAEKDRIVPQRLTLGCFKDSPIHWIQSTSHLLPVAEHYQCGRLILKFLNR